MHVCSASTVLSAGAGMRCRIVGRIIKIIPMILLRFLNQGFLERTDFFSFIHYFVSSSKVINNFIVFPPSNADSFH